MKTKCKHHSKLEFLCSHLMIGPVCSCWEGYKTIIRCDHFIVFCKDCGDKFILDGRPYNNIIAPAHDFKRLVNLNKNSFSGSKLYYGNYLLIKPIII